MPAKDLSELIPWLKAHPNEASMGMNTLGFRLLALRFQKQTGAQFNIIPYPAAGSVVGDLVAGQIDLAIGTLTTQLPLLRAGSEKAYAVQAETRSVLAPDIPTFAEMGLPELSYTNWYGLFAPKETPKDIIGKLSAAAMRQWPIQRCGPGSSNSGTRLFPTNTVSAPTLPVPFRPTARWAP
jgi:tripartite-type tricarboxylate transporter receptor subunit TctC